MRSRPRLLWSLAVGGALLTLTPFNPSVRADVAGENAPQAAPEKSAASPAPQSQAAAEKAPSATPQPKPAAEKAMPVTPAPMSSRPASMPTVTNAPHSQPHAAGSPTPVGTRTQFDLSSIRATGEELRFLELTNEERAKRGMSRLVWDPLLTYVARQHSDEMREKSYFSHHSPTAGIATPMDRYLKVVSTGRPTYACVGENLFYCTLVDVQRGHNAFMNSPTHRENVLFPRYERMGVGIVKNDRGEFWVTEMFISNTDPNLVAKRMSVSNR